MKKFSVLFCLLWLSMNVLSETNAFQIFNNYNNYNKHNTYNKHNKHNNHNSLKANIRFQDVSFFKGLNHIHSLEHVATTHSLGVPYFKIRETFPPYIENGAICLNSTCSVLNFQPMKVIFHSKHVNTNEMSFLNMKDEKFLTIHLKVLPCLRDPKSHLFQIEIFPQFHIPQWLGKLYMEIVKLISANEDALFYFSGKKKFQILSNCQKYRKLVFTQKNIKKENVYKV